MPISGRDILLYEKKDRIVTMTLNRPESDFLPFAFGLESNLLGLEDTVEGPRAFMERRKPVYKNR